MREIGHERAQSPSIIAVTATVAGGPDTGSGAMTIAGIGLRDRITTALHRRTNETETTPIAPVH